MGHFLQHPSHYTMSLFHFQIGIPILCNCVFSGNICKCVTDLEISMEYFAHPGRNCEHLSFFSPALTGQPSELRSQCSQSYHSELEWNFCVGFSWEGLQVTHMVFAYHWTSQVSRTSEKIKKGQENFQRPQQRPQIHFIEIL